MNKKDIKDTEKDVEDVKKADESKNMKEDKKEDSELNDIDVATQVVEEEKAEQIEKLKKKYPNLNDDEIQIKYLEWRNTKLDKEKNKKRKRALQLQRLKTSSKAIGAGFLIFFLLVIIAATIYDNTVLGTIKPEYMDFSTFIEKVENDEVYAIYDYDEDTFRIKLIEDVPEEYRKGQKASYNIFEIGRENWYETQNTVYEDFSELIAKHNVPIVRGLFKTWSSRIFDLLLAIISLLVPISLILVLLFLMLNPTGFNKDKMTITQTSNIRFENVIGHSEIIDDLKLYVELLRKPSAAKKIGVKIPKGMIFNGPPGTGKTLIAKALAGEAGVPFIYVNASNVIELYVGMGAKTIRQVFKKARSMSPCVVFIDEIDAIGGKRGRWGTSSEDTQTINALLQELDGFTEMDNVLVIAATNNIGSLDEALLRSGRFDRKLEILPPKDKLTRLDLLKLYVSKLTLANDVNLNEIAEQIVGFTGADVKVLCNEAALIALQNEQEAVTQSNFFEAIDRMMLKGNRLKDKSNIKEEDTSLVAYHEAGHAVMCYLQGMPIMRASVQGSTSGVGGFVIPADGESLFTTKTDMLNMIRVAYAGRVSESIKRGDDCVTNGASNDIQRATQLLQSYLMLFGFSDTLGMLDLKTLVENNICDNKLLLDEMRKISKNCYDTVKETLKDNYNLVEVVAKALMEKEILTGAEFEEVIQEEMKRQGKVLADLNTPLKSVTMYATANKAVDIK